MYINSAQGIGTLEKVRLSVAEITPGMKLAKPITNANGSTLMPAGIRLTPMFIARIKKWNIESLDVLIDEKESQPEATSESARIKAAAARGSGDDDEELSEEQLEFARGVAAEVSARFVNVRDNPLMMQLRAVVIKRLVMHGPDGVVNVLRQWQTPPPANGEGV